MTTERDDLAALAAALSYSIERISRLEQAMQRIEAVSVQGLEGLRADLTEMLRGHGAEIASIGQTLNAYVASVDEKGATLQ